MKNTVTQQEIDNLLANAEVNAETVFNKCTVVSVKLENGFIMVESSASVDPKNYDFEIGKEICLSNIKNRLWELEGYSLQKQLYCSQQ